MCSYEWEWITQEWIIDIKNHIFVKFKRSLIAEVAVYVLVWKKLEIFYSEKEPGPDNHYIF